MHHKIREKWEACLPLWKWKVSWERTLPMGSPLQAHSQADLIRKKYTWKSRIWKLIPWNKANLIYPSWKAASLGAKKTEAPKGHWQKLRRQLPSLRLRGKVKQDLRNKLGGGSHKAKMRTLEERAWLLQQRRNRVPEGAHLSTLRALTTAVNTAGTLCTPICSQLQGNSTRNNVASFPSGFAAPSIGRG